MSGPILVPILGDQLTRDLASLRGRAKDDTVILMMEVWDEATYVKHHKQKIALIFSAMRHFAAELSDAGWTVDYVKLTDDGNSGSFTGEVARAIERHDPRAIHVVEAGEWRVQQAIEQWVPKKLNEVIKTGDELSLDTALGKLTNHTTGEEYLLNPLGEVAEITVVKKRDKDGEEIEELEASELVEV